MELAKSYRCSDYAFCAPEIVHRDQFSTQSDIYSLGSLIVNLLGILVLNTYPKSYTSKKAY